VVRGSCGFAVRRLFKGKAAKRPAATFVPGGSIIRARDPCDALCWTDVGGADGLATRVGARAGGGGVPVTRGATAFSSDDRDKGSVLYCGFEIGAGRAGGGVELDTVRFSATNGDRPPNSLGMFINVRSNVPLLLTGVLLVDDTGSPSILCSPSFGGDAIPKDALRDGPPISGKNRLGGSV